MLQIWTHHAVAKCFNAYTQVASCSFVCLSCMRSHFRTEYGCIAEIWSIVPPPQKKKIIIINMMALTATASTSNKKVIMQKLCIEEDKCAVTEKSYQISQISVWTAPDSIEWFLYSHFFRIFGLMERQQFKAVLFSKTYSDLTEVAMSLVSELHPRDGLLVTELVWSVRCTVHPLLKM